MMARLQHRGGRDFNTVPSATSTPWGRDFNTVPPGGGRDFNTVGARLQHRAPEHRTGWGGQGEPERLNLGLCPSPRLAPERTKPRTMTLSVNRRG